LQSGSHRKVRVRKQNPITGWVVSPLRWGGWSWWPQSWSSICLWQYRWPASWWWPIACMLWQGAVLVWDWILNFNGWYFLYQRRAASTIASITASWGNKVHPILLARMKQTSNHEILDTVELTYRKLWDSGYWF
jgi:hypothetical protein